MTISEPAGAPITARSGIDGNLIFGYSLLMAAVQIAVGIAYGTLRIVLEWPIEPWGAVSAKTILKLLLLAAASFAVYWMMARRHPAHYFANGVSVAALTGLINVVFGLVQAPSLEASMMGWFVLAMISHVILFLVVYAVLRSLAVVGHRRIGNSGA